MNEIDVEKVVQMGETKPFIPRGELKPMNRAERRELEKMRRRAAKRIQRSSGGAGA